MAKQVKTQTPEQALEKLFQNRNKIKNVVVATIYFPNDELSVFQLQDTQDMFRKAVENTLEGLDVEVRMNYITSRLHDKVEIQYDHFKF